MELKFIKGWDGHNCSNAIAAIKSYWTDYPSRMHLSKPKGIEHVAVVFPDEVTIPPLTDIYKHVTVDDLKLIVCKESDCPDEYRFFTQRGFGSQIELNRFLKKDDPSLEVAPAQDESFEYYDEGDMPIDPKLWLRRTTKMDKVERKRKFAKRYHPDSGEYPNKEAFQLYWAKL